MTANHPQKLYIEMINLERASERRAHMVNELSQASIQAAVHPAVDFRAQPEHVIEAETLSEGPWGLFHLQDRAVTISHARVWDRFLAIDATHCFVIEDDVYLSPELSLWLNDLSWWPEGADVVKFERWYHGNRLKILLQQPGAKHLGRRIARMLSRHTGAAGYMLTRHAAERLLAARPFSLTVDQLLFNLNASPVASSLNVYQITPALLQQGNLPQDENPAPSTRRRPVGATLRRQRLKRGWYEIAYPIRTLIKMLTGHAKLEQIEFARHTITPLPEQATAE